MEHEMTDHREQAIRLREKLRKLSSSIMGCCLNDEPALDCIAAALQAAEAHGMELAADLVEFMELGSPSGLSRKEQLRIYDVLAQTEQAIRQQAKEAHASRQGEELFQFSPIAELSYKILAHDAALREQVARLEAELARASQLIASLTPLAPITEADVQWAKARLANVKERP